MKAKFIDFIEMRFNGMADFVNRVIFSASAVVALATLENIICTIF